MDAIATNCYSVLIMDPCEDIVKFSYEYEECVSDAPITAELGYYGTRAIWNTLTF